MKPTKIETEVSISYHGPAAQTEAEKLNDSLQGSGLSITGVTSFGDEPLLGAAEIIITIALAPIAHAAAKAVISTTLHYLRDYFVERVQSGDAAVNGQVLVKESVVGPDKRFPFTLRKATAQTIKAFFDNVEQSILKS